MQRRALTLLEVIIGTALFATMLVVVTESAISVRSYATMNERTDDLEAEGRSILRQLSSDLSNAAWFYERPSPSDQAVPLYPKVIKPADPATSFGDQIMFLKLRTERSNDETPDKLVVEHVNLNNGNNPTKRMSQYATAPAVFSLVLNDAFIDNGSATFVSAVWESKDAGLTYEQNQLRPNLRHYRYTVELHPVSGRGELRRSYINGLPPEDGGPEPWVMEENQHWGRHIANLTIDTALTTATSGQRRLSPNQIRIKLELRRDAEGSVAQVRRTFYTTIALRSITNEVTN
jgi:type II secretory pathway pseudopilin PulG